MLSHPGLPPAGLWPPCSGWPQALQDAPPGSTFYLPIERLASRGIIGGYPCGGPGELCIDPANRAYFRPNNPANRGQLSKIALNSFFPGCAGPLRT